MQKKTQQRAIVNTNTEWKSLETYWICNNTNGVVVKSKISGCGGLARNYVGDWLGGFYKNVSIYNITSVELWGVVEGLRFAQSKGYTRIELQVESQEVVNAINGEFDHLKVLSLICKIKVVVDGFVEVRVVKNP